VIRYARNNANRQFWAKRFKEFGNHTMEMTVLGQRLIMTDEPENIKAILATQFHDFGECGERGGGNSGGAGLMSDREGRIVPSAVAGVSRR
jgi:hypothetical protein